jgi:hypothetical protein
MGASRYLVDPSGVTRHIKRRFCIDPAGGVARLIKKRYDIDASGVARLTFLYGDSFTMVAGAGLNGKGAVSEIGFASGAFGSLTPTTLGDGKLLLSLWDLTSDSVRTFRVGTTSDPGQAYLASLTANGQTLLGASATYTWVAASAYGQWTWTVSSQFVAGTTYPIMIIRS